MYMNSVDIMMTLDFESNTYERWAKIDKHSYDMWWSLYCIRKLAE